MARPSSPSLRAALAQAVEDRKRGIRNGWCKRKDFDTMRLAIMQAEVFLQRDPYATDERVRKWCTDHYQELCCLVPGNQPRVLAKLLFSEIKRRVEQTYATENDPAQLAISGGIDQSA